MKAARLKLIQKNNNASMSYHSRNKTLQIPIQRHTNMHMQQQKIVNVNFDEEIEDDSKDGWVFNTVGNFVTVQVEYHIPDLIIRLTAWYLSNLNRVNDLTVLIKSGLMHLQECSDNTFPGQLETIFYQKTLKTRMQSFFDANLQNRVK